MALDPNGMTRMVTLQCASCRCLVVVAESDVFQCNGILDRKCMACGAYLTPAQITVQEMTRLKNESLQRLGEMFVRYTKAQAVMPQEAVDKGMDQILDEQFSYAMEGAIQQHFTLFEKEFQDKLNKLKGESHGADDQK